MKGDSLLAALDLPGSSRVDQRVPKKLLLENGAPTPADKRIINDGIEELHWLAALKPTTVGVPEFRDEAREYLEIAVLRLILRPVARAPRLVELVHRAVPYPVLLLAEASESVGLSAAHKRWSQGEARKTVLDGEVVVIEWAPDRDASRWPGFLQMLGLSRQPRATLLGLYQGWLDALHALQAARVTGTLTFADHPERAVSRRAALQECARLDAEITRLRSAASKEKQMARRVELNLELKRMEAARAVAHANL